MLSFDFVVEVSSTSFCSNPDALGFDESEKGIFDSLKSIARLPLGSPKEGDRLADSAAGAAGELPIGEAGKELLLVLVSGLMRSTGFFVELLLMSFVLFRQADRGSAEESSACYKC